jgi:aminoglycoside phosphotransferase
VPEITDATRNFYSYKYVDGMTISKTRNPSTIRHLLDWAEENLWMEQHAHSNKEFDDICRKFYYEKSKERLLQLIQTRGIQDEATTINDQDVPSAAVLINQALAHLEVESKQTQIHGDFILDNILKTKDSFCLIDWRQDFGGSLVSGDQYYDLAKLKHSFHINHEIVSNNQFFVSQGTTKVECGILVKDSLMMMNDVFTKWVNEKKLNSRKIQILTSLIWLNMAPLHHHPFDQFLYYYGRLNLWRNLNDA